MWLVNQALSENTRYTQLGDGRWKAEYNGFVKMTAEGKTPTESEKQLSQAMDTLLASLISGGEVQEEDARGALQQVRSTRAARRPGSRPEVRDDPEATLRGADTGGQILQRRSG
jgi:predicted RNase H-like HicB family nuclease